MINYYTLKYLVYTVNDNLSNAAFSFAITPRKNVIEFYLENPYERYRIITDTGSTNTVFFVDSYRPAKKSNVYSPFESLNSEEIKEIELADRDRFIIISFYNKQRLIFTLYGPRANVYLVQDDKVLESFKNNDELQGTKPPKPRPAVLWRDIKENDNLKRKIVRLNPLFPRKLIPYVIKHFSLNGKTDQELKEIIVNLSEELEHHPVARILKTGEICLLSEDTLPEPSLKTFEDINQCVRYHYYHKLSKSRFDQLTDQLDNQFQNQLKKLRTQLDELQNAEKSLERADKYEKYGHLLMANIYRDEGKYAEELTVSNFYNDNKEIAIPLKHDLNLTENAQHYYEKAKKARKSYDVASSRVGKVEEKIKELEQLYQQFKSFENIYDLNKWIKKNQKVLNEFQLAVQKNQKELTYPFRKREIKGYEVWIGKNAKSNDILTSRAHKEDIWLHARGVGGSHVVIRMNNDKNYPQKNVLQEVAALAAFYSKARGSKMAPVSYTKKKYVRKPKGAQAGTVLLDREEVLMVEPKAD